jgi:hypothetical protein
MVKLAARYYFFAWETSTKLCASSESMAVSNQPQSCLQWIFSYLIDQPGFKSVLCAYFFSGHEHLQS